MYDFIIVGAGISGIYLTALLCEKYKDKKILLIEKEKRIGGLINTKYFQEGEKKIKYEAGGAVLYSYQKVMLSLVKKYDVEVKKILFDKDNLHKTRFYDCSERSTPLGKAVALKFRKMIYKLTKMLNEKPKSYFLDKTLEQLCLEHYSFKDTRLLEFIYGYSGEFREANSIVALTALKKELFDSNAMYYFKNGYIELIEKMYNSVKTKIDVMLSTELVSFKSIDNGIEVKVNEGLGVSMKKFDGKKVIFAIPQQAILKVAGLNKKQEEMISSSVEPVSLCRIFAKYDVDKNPWIKKMKYSSVNNPLKQIIPLNAEAGIVQISYSDWIQADYWGSLTAKLKKKQVTKLLKEAMPWEKNITEPINVKTFYYKDAIHFWTQGYDYTEMAPAIMNIKKNLFICGESFSKNQGWCEGAVQSVQELVLSHL